MPSAKLRAKVDRYSFFVRLLPPLLHTGLTRRTNIPIALIDGVLSAMWLRKLSIAPPSLAFGWGLFPVYLLRLCVDGWRFTLTMVH